LGSTPTPVPTTAQSPGFAGAMALICLLGAAYLIVKKER
jgi:PGF-CTERM protein